LPTGTHADGQSRRVLIVEDSYLLSDALSDLLRVSAWSPSALSARSQEQMALASAETFDTGLVDMSLHSEPTLPL
jgi:DNA-binding response OmpR family regulator